MAHMSEAEYNALIATRNQKTQKPPALPEGGKLKGVSGVIRQSSRQPNKTELRFEQEYLKPWLATKEIEGYDYEAITLKIANGCRYTPDWVAWRNPCTVPSGLRVGLFYEIKARDMIWDDAIVKLKVAASKFPQFEFYICAYSKTGWTIERVLP